MAIFHEITIERPKGISTGFLTISRVPDVKIIWQQYPETAHSVTHVVGKGLVHRSIERLEFSGRTIQGVVIQCGFPGFVLVTYRSGEMFQFSLSKEKALAVAQVLAGLTDIDAIGGLYYSCREQGRVFHFSIVENRLVAPAELRTDVDIEFVKPDAILERFGITKALDPVKALDFSNYAELVDAVRLCGCGKGMRANIWPIVFRILPFGKNDDILALRVEEYKQIRSQWEHFTPWQLRFNNPVREAFSTIRVDVRRTAPLWRAKNFEDWQGMLTRILRTFTLFHRNVRYTQGLNDMAAVFAANFIPSIDHGLTLDEAEALAFWCLASFVEVIASGLLTPDLLATQTREMGFVMQQIQVAHPAVAQWLKETGVGDLNFLVGPFMLGYGRSFSFNGVSRLWETLATVADPVKFLRYFTAALLILTYPSLVQIAVPSMGRLVGVMDKLFRQQDVQSVIAVAVAMQRNELERRREPPPHEFRDIWGVEDRYYLRYASEGLFC